MGLLIGVELVEDKESKKPLELNKVNEVIYACKAKGLIIGKNGDTVEGYNNVLTLAPPLSMTEDDFSFLTKTFKEVICSL